MDPVATRYRGGHTAGPTGYAAGVESAAEGRPWSMRRARQTAPSIPRILISQLRSAAGAAASFGPRVVIAMGGSDSGSDTGAITAHDPGFDRASFVAWVKHVHFALVTAWKSGDAQAIRPYVSDSFYPRLSADITQAAGSALPDVVDEDNVVISSAHSDASVDTIAVHISSHATLPQGNAGRAVWTFQRSAQATTPPGGVTASDARTCPSCGAPLRLDPSGECTYCRAAFRASAADWLLIDIAPAPAQVTPWSALAHTTSWSGVAASPAASKVGRWVVGAIIVFGVGVGLIGAIVGIVAAMNGASTVRSATARTNHTVNSIVSSVNSQVSTAFGSRPTVPAATPPTPPPPSLAPRATLSGAVNLSPSDLGAEEFVLNGHTGGSCLPAKEQMHTIGLNITFDSGATMDGQFALSQPIGRSASADLANGGAAFVHFRGPTQASVDDETWPMPAGQPGLVTVKTDASGGER